MATYNREDPKADATKTDASPESTWGATREAKDAWASKHGRAAEEKGDREAKPEKEAK